MPTKLHVELERVDREILRLNAQRDLLLRLIDEEPKSGGLAAARVPPITGIRKSSLRPQNPENTQDILDAVAAHPGSTVKQIAEIVGKARNADAKEVMKLYNTAYGLARRGKIIKDEANRVRLAD